MAEPFSIVSGVAGVLSLGITTAKGLYHLYESYSSCEEAVSSMLESLESLEITFEQVDTVIQYNPILSKSEVQIQKCLDRCSASLQVLSKKYNKIQQSLPKSKDPRDGAWSVTAVKGAMGSLAKLSTYPFKESTLCKLKETSQELQNELKILLTILNIETTQLVHGAVKNIPARQIQDERDTILKWLSEPDYIAQHADLASKRKLGTGEWLFLSPKFQQWVSGAEKTLFLSGMPGAGKTMMMCALIEHLTSKVEKDNIAVCFLYCNYTTRSRQTVRSLLGSLLTQLIRASPAVPGVLRHRYQHHLRTNSRPNAADIICLLRECSAGFDRTYVVVDALDECGQDVQTSHELINRLFELQSSTAATFLAASSRSEPSITSYFETKLCLEIRATGEDIRIYAMSRMKYSSQCIQRSRPLQELICSKLIELADGMFLLARLYMDSLQASTSPKSIQKTLNTLAGRARTLDAAYSDAGARIQAQPPESVEIAMRAIMWITHARRPLSISELQTALAIEISEPFDVTNVSEIEDVVSVCAGLVTVDERTELIRFVHYTAQDFFQRNFAHWSPLAPETLALTCLSYVCLNDFVDLDTSKDIHQNLSKYPFLDYCLRYWGYYAQHDENSPVSELVMRFLSESKKVNLCARTITALQHSPPRSPGKVVKGCGLHVASYFGLNGAVKSLLSGGEDINGLDENGRTPLSWASAYGTDGIVELLLEHENLSASLTDEDGQTPIVWAARYGHSDIVKVLMNRTDIDPDLPVDHGQTALSWAAEYGHEAAVQVLLENPTVKANSTDEREETPLSWACYRGQIDVVKTLLEHPLVDPDHRNDDGQTPLMKAARCGHVDVVDFLLHEAKVAPDLKDNDGLTALAWAAKCGHEEAVRVLAERDDVGSNARDDEGHTPLAWASRRGNAAIVALLYGMEGINLDSRLNNGQSYLSLASECNHVEIVRFLVTQDGVDIESRDLQGQTAFSWACRCGQDDVVALLLDYADIQSKDYSGRTGYDWAVFRERELVIQLLDRHREVDSRSGSQSSTLTLTRRQ